MRRTKETAGQSGELDRHMFVIKDFLDEFYNKTLFRAGKKKASDMSASLIKFLFAFPDERQAYPIGELGAQARVQRSTMTDMVDRMERDGLAERGRSAGDRRVVTVRLTDRGIALRREFYQKRRQEFQELFSVLAPEDIHRFVRHLKGATDILKKIP